MNAELNWYDIIWQLVSNQVIKLGLRPRSWEAHMGEDEMLQGLMQTARDRLISSPLSGNTLNALQHIAKQKQCHNMDM